MHKIAYSVVAVLALLFAFAAWGCGGEEEGLGEGVASPLVSEPTENLALELDDFYFDPKEIQGKVGQTFAVSAFSEGQQTHNLTIDEFDVDRTFERGSPSQHFDLTLTEAGNFKFYCRFHESQGMTGTLSVTE